jgi:hypothetical protein
MSTARSTSITVAMPISAPSSRGRARSSTLSPRTGRSAPAARGLRCIFRGRLPAGGRKKRNIEVYDRGRYVTVTGHHLPGTPTTVETAQAALEALLTRVFTASKAETNGQGHIRRCAPISLDDAALLERARAARNGDVFARLWAGDANGYPSPSEADLALCNRLAFWTGRDADRMDRLFRQSGLMRPKWDERHGTDTYGALTIQTAIAGCRDVYAPRATVTAPPVPEAQPSRLRTVSWRDLSSGDPEPIAYAWHGWVALATVALIVGAGESLKSWLALYLAVMLAAGRAPFDDRDAPPSAPVTVLYLTAENAIAEEERRARLLKAGLELPDELPLTFIAAENLCLGNDEDYAAVQALVQTTRPGAIFIDSAIALSGLADENDNPAVRDFMRRRVLPLARQDSATVFLLGHSPKPPVQPGARFGDEHVARGASDWRNAADAVLYLRRDPTLGELAVVLRHSKVRVGARHAPVWFQLEDVVPGKAARVVFGGAYDDTSGQGAAAGLYKAVQTATSAVKSATGGIYLTTLISVLTDSGCSKATARRAVGVLRGKQPWPAGTFKGKRQAVVTEDQHGRQVFLTFESALNPLGEPESDDD